MKRIIAISMLVLLVIGIFVGCGSSSEAPMATAISFSKQSYFIDVSEAESITSFVTVEPAGAKVVYTISDESVATISENGEIRGIKAGSVDLTASSVDGKVTATCKIRITDYKKTSSSLTSSKETNSYTMRNLSVEEIMHMTCGAVMMNDDENGYVHFNRYTMEQLEAYQSHKPDSKQYYSSAGIKFSFKTDSSKLYLDVFTEAATGRKFFSFDVFVNGEYVDSLDNFGSQGTANYLNRSFTLGDYSKTIDLGEGEKQVTVYFPWTVTPTIKKVSIVEGASFEPQKPDKKMLVYGDSITIGELAARPSARYSSLLADYLGAEEINKAVGGEQFFPQLAACEEEYIPDIITVAYGTNDWRWGSRNNFETGSVQFIEKLIALYPDTPIYVITPIWREDMENPDGFCDFTKLYDMYCDLLDEYKNVTIIHGFNLVPHDGSYYADGRLHPNDVGFKVFFESLRDSVDFKFKK